MDSVEETTVHLHMSNSKNMLKYVGLQNESYDTLMSQEKA